MPDSSIDFFISYQESDKAWAEWIAYQLTEAGYSTWVKSMDSHPGANILVEKQAALEAAVRVIVVLSPGYLIDAEVRLEWQIAYSSQKLLPVRVLECTPTGALGHFTAIDLVELPPREARHTLLSGVKYGRKRPTRPPLYPGKTSPVWRMPAENPFFVGREEDINHLRAVFIQDQGVSIVKQVLKGLGGVGKSQIAIKYAYHYRSEYKIALWINCHSRETLGSEIVEIAGEITDIDFLDYPAGEREHEATVTLLDWLRDRTDRWLLIFDNVESPDMVKDYIPLAGKGHILLTTRTQIVADTSKSIEINKLNQQDGLSLLLRRAQLTLTIPSPGDPASRDYEIAMRISQLLDGHPLALDQAGAYIEETDCGLSGFLAIYEKQRTQLLERRGDSSFQHPESVVATWSSCFDSLKEKKPLAYDLLQLCAFLDPDAIPEKIIIEGASDIGNDFNDAVAALRRFSLIHRDSGTNTLTVHRLVQTVVKDQMDAATRQYWAERAVRCVQQIISSNGSLDWQRYVPHMQACAAHIDELEIAIAEAGELLEALRRHG